MKQMLVFFILLLPVSAFAENRGEMTEEQMQQMMSQAQDMQTCMQKIDQSEMQAFEQRAKQMQAETQTLCAEGKRDEAMQKAMDFGKEAADNKAMQEMKKCGQGMSAMMPKMAAIADGQDEKSGRHVCDKP